MTDTFNRKIEYARLSVTDLCDMRCRYCMPDGVIKKTHADILSIEQLQKISSVLANLGVSKQRITGGEPLVRKGVLSLIKSMGENPKVSCLAMTTNGQRLKEQAGELKSLGVNAVNISIDTLDDKKFTSLTAVGSLQKTLAGIEEAKKQNFDSLKLNAVLLKGINDTEIYSLARFAGELNVPIRFIELMPFLGKAEFEAKYFIAADEIIKQYDLTFLPKKSEGKKVLCYAFPDGVEVSFISPISHKFCCECNRIRISADGKLLNCLHEAKEYDLREHIDTDLEQFITSTVQLKPLEHHIEEGVLQKRNMDNIGG